MWLTNFLAKLGRVRAILRGASGGAINVPGTLVIEVPLSGSPRTLFARSGNGFVNVVLAVTAILLAVSFFRRRGPTAPTVAAAVLVVLTALSVVLAEEKAGSAKTAWPARSYMSSIRATTTSSPP